MLLVLSGPSAGSCWPSGTPTLMSWGRVVEAATSAVIINGGSTSRTMAPNIVTTQKPECKHEGSKRNSTQSSPSALKAAAGLSRWQREVTAGRRGQALACCTEDATCLAETWAIVQSMDAKMYRLDAGNVLGPGSVSWL